MMVIIKILNRNAKEEETKSAVCPDPDPQDLFIGSQAGYSKIRIVYDIVF